MKSFNLIEYIRVVNYSIKTVIKTCIYKAQQSERKVERKKKLSVRRAFYDALVQNNVSDASQKDIAILTKPFDRCDNALTTSICR